LLAEETHLELALDPASRKQASKLRQVKKKKKKIGSPGRPEQQLRKTINTTKHARGLKKRISEKTAMATELAEEI
jgi:hypothetical protein